MAAAAVWRGNASEPSSPWFRTHWPLTLAIAVLLYGAVFALRMSLSDPVNVVSMLYVFPVALLGMARGRWTGLVGGVVAVALVALWLLVREVDISVVGWASRVLPLLLVGLLVGDANDRLDRAAEEREAHHLAVERHRDAVEINDSLVQGMSAAKWSIEAGRTEAGLKTLSETVELGHRLVSELIRQSGKAPIAVETNGHSMPGTADTRP